MVAKTKMHVLDTVAAMVSGSRLRAGLAAARYVDGLGGKPQATVVGTGLLTSTVNAALANGMAAHGDETDDSHLKARFHPGCGIVPAALATAELAGRSGNDLLRAVALGYDIGARSIYALGFGELYTERHSTHSLATTFGATAAAAAMLRLDPTQVRHAFSFAAQQASGVPYWERDREHVEKAFDFGGMGARNGVTAATMVATGIHRQSTILLSGDEEPVHRARRRQAAAGRAHGRPRQALRDHRDLDQEMVRRLAAAVGARLRDASSLEDPAGAGRPRQAHRGRHAGRPAAHRRQQHHPGHLPAAPGRPDDRGRRRRLRQRA